MFEKIDPPNMEKISFRNGVLIDRDNAVVIGSIDKYANDEVAHTCVFSWTRKKNWYVRIIDWTADSIGIYGKGIHDVVISGPEGKVLDLSTDIEKEIRNRENNPAVVRSLRRIQGELYAVGMNSLVCIRRENGEWDSLIDKITKRLRFEDIAGIDDNLCLVGWDGEIWFFNGKYWISSNSPTNLILTSVCVSNAGVFYCCGQQGMILKGREAEWEIINQDLTTEDFWDISEFDGKILVSSLKFTYELTARGLEEINFDKQYPLSSYKLVSIPGQLWNIGEKSIFENIGGKWKKVI